MKKILFALSLIIFITQFYSCSWIVGFYLINTTAQEIEIELNLQDSIKGRFPIFDYQQGSLYQINKENEIIYDESSRMKYDTLNKFSHLQFKLPAHSAIQFGALHNDKYKNSNQYFINGRAFNLKNVIIKERELNITKENFDQFFKLTNNNVTYLLK